MFRKKLPAAAAMLSNIFNYISMAALFLVAAILFLDIALRLAAEISILGTYEIIEMGMIVVIFAALAHTQFLKGHVRVTMLVEKFPPGVKRWIDGFLLTITAAVCAVVTYASFVQAHVYYEKQATTAVLKMPYYPFAYTLAMGLTLLTIAFFLDAVASFSSDNRTPPHLN